MDIDIFTISEIITIIMEMVNNLDYYAIYGLYDDEKLNISKPINDKLESLNGNDYEDFMGKVSHIAEEILPMKNGELNELNHCHEEIAFLAEDILKMYINKN